jgi:hypothetical protein
MSRTSRAAWKNNVLNNEKILKYRFPAQQKQIQKLGTQTGTIIYIGVKKISMQFMKFLDVTLISASGVTGSNRRRKSWLSVPDRVKLHVQ